MKALQTSDLAIASNGDTMHGMSRKTAKAKPSSRADEKKDEKKPVYTVYARVPPVLGEAFEKILGRTRRSATAEVIVALEKHLAEAGLWPPSAE